MIARHKRFTRLLVAIMVALVAAGVYLSYELGRYRAGYSLLDERRRIERVEAKLAERDELIEGLERRRAILETSREIDGETYARLEDELERLQDRIQAQEEELAFYRSIVTPADGVSGLRIQRLEIGAADAERHHKIRLTLVQAILHKDRVRGRVRLAVAGQLDGATAELAYEELAAQGDEAPLDYDFRYFQTLERELVLPVGFEPDTVTVEARPRGSRGDAVTQRFSWNTLGG